MPITIVSPLTMGKPDMRPHAELSHGDLRVDASGHLYDAAMRRAVRETAGEGSVDGFEALAALRLASKRIHDAMERFAEGHGLSESRLRVLTRLCHRPRGQLPLGALAEGMDVTPRTMTDIVDVFLGVVLLFGAGIFAATQVQQDLLPDISVPAVLVITPYPGASPEIVDQQVSVPVVNA